MEVKVVFVAVVVAVEVVFMGVVGVEVDVVGVLVMGLVVVFVDFDVTLDVVFMGVESKSMSWES